MPKRYENNAVLVFSDTHFPYQHKYTFEFLQDLNSQYKFDRIVHDGDLMDMYSVSSYPKDMNHPDSWNKELKKARKDVAKLISIFPNMEIVESNHDDRIYKKSRLSGIPREAMVPYKDIVGAPDTWKWHRELSLRCETNKKTMFFAHTKAGGAMACAKDKGVTTILGHSHTKFGAEAFKPNKTKTIWGVDAGCLVSDKGSPYEYNKRDRGRPIQGAVILLEGEPVLMPL
jgi:predicted phosphodiesterase